MSCIVYGPNYIKDLLVALGCGLQEVDIGGVESIDEKVHIFGVAQVPSNLEQTESGRSVDDSSARKMCITVLQQIRGLYDKPMSSEAWTKCD